MNFEIGKTGPAAHLFQLPWSTHKRESVKVIFSFLNFHLIKMYAALVYSYRGSGFHSAGSYAVSGDGLGEMVRGWLRDSSTWHLDTSNMHQSIEECAGCEYYAFTMEFCTLKSSNSLNLTIFHNQLGYRV